MIRHLIVFNISETATHEDCLKVVARGREQLMQIPGVVRFSFGTSVQENAKYRYNLAIDFQDERVIEFYKHHPIHVAYADDYFRPLAADRITTDYVIED